MREGLCKLMGVEVKREWENSKNHASQKFVNPMSLLTTYIKTGDHNGMAPV
jgi:hypothetical protein